MLTLLINSLAVLRLKQSERADRKTHGKVRGLPPMSDHLLRDIGLFDMGTIDEQDWETSAQTRPQTQAQLPKKNATKPLENAQEHAPEPPLQTRST
ncbi:hypothetical protein NFC81_06285 [Salinispirillum sp. LH 10-3-1]|uniref:DUF1127 domain-containing protein n=1 Tax=Salinispirillum sp. LH 10-3-1 TaxID=2952525 RepID=A0AB38YJ47_9GAMM